MRSMSVKNMRHSSLSEHARRILILDLLDTGLVGGRSGVGSIVLALQTLGGGLDGGAGGGVGSFGGRHIRWVRSASGRRGDRSRVRSEGEKL